MSKTNNSHKTSRIHIDESGKGQGVYTSGKYSSDLHLKDGTPISVSETSHYKNTYKDTDGNHQIKESQAKRSGGSSDEWSDYAQTESDF